MIEVLGQSPVNSALSAGRSKFMSIFRRKPAGYGDIPGRYSRSYAATARGQLIRKNDYKKEGSPRYYFQFNPQTISDVKSTLYETRNYAGLPYVDYVWGGGGERTISFSLFMDNTPQSKTAAFIPTALGSKEAKTIKLEGATINSEGVIVTEKKTLGQQLGLSVAKGNASFQFEGDAYSLSRVSERGILDEVEYIQSFLYPEPVGDEKTPMFAYGGIVSAQQFRPPAVAILTLGPLFLQGLVKAASVEYQLFDQDLTPIRATMQIEFAVFEFEDITRFRNK